MGKPRASGPAGPSDAELREVLAGLALRVTQQRLELLRELHRLEGPTSHPELTERMASSGLDRATIYRNLNSLAEAGAIVRTQLGDGVWRYELPRQKSAHSAHPHFVCNHCGDLSCLPAEAVALRGAARRLDVSEVQLRGLCGSCHPG